MQTIERGEVSLSYETDGTGAPILFIAGTMCTREVWSGIRPMLSGFQHIAFDNRDVGRSSLSPVAYSIGDLAQDALALLDGLRIESAHIVGHSMGGQIAQELALLAPARVRSLVLANTWAKFSTRERSLFKLWRDIRRDSSSYDTFLRAVMFFSYGATTLTGRSCEEMADAFKAAGEPQTSEAFFRNVTADLAADTADRLHMIEAPTLILWGDEDVIVPPAHAAQLREKIPHAEAVCIEGTGHLSFIEAPEPFGKAVLEFLQRQR